MDSLLHITKKQKLLQARKHNNTKSMALKRHCETSHERQERLQDMSVRQDVRLHAETPEKRQDRLQDMSVRQDVRLHAETPEKRQD